MLVNMTVTCCYDCCLLRRLARVFWDAVHHADAHINKHNPFAFSFSFSVCSLCSLLPIGIAALTGLINE